MQSEGQGAEAAPPRISSAARHPRASRPANRGDPGVTNLVTIPHHRHLRAGEPPAHAPNAALLIDFDNVTLGIRSDLAKELKHLLGSDIIKGKVAVSRAYADWRRYHQYIVPLSESSIDLIFAPAFGTNKKNATDIRLAIDAMELVFTRPEIGTFILLSGDSDFSTLVIKLKEYGKYVIGVGMRESASDLLIQNCDEYFSYSDLAGLTKESEVPSTQRDPWQLVQDAVAQMARDRDVMRSDRLKQVMQQLDPNFDEKNAGPGYSRFSRFVLEASHRGLIKLTKLDNGQFEIAPATPGAPASAPAASAAAAPAEPRGEGRGEGRGRRRGRGRGRGERGDRPEREAGESRPEPAPRAPEADAKRSEGLTLARAFDLVRLALSELPSPVGHEALRLRMVALHGRMDPMLEPERFPRLLRQVHDAEVADVRKIGEDEFEVLTRGAEPTPAGAPARTPQSESTREPVRASAPATTPADAAARGGIRFRRGSKPPMGRPEIAMVGVVSLDEEAPAETAKKKPAARKKAAKPAAEVADETAAPKKPTRSRAKKKVEG